MWSGPLPAKSASSARPRLGLFARGETQAITLATLGTGDDVQEFDAYTGAIARRNSAALQLSEFLRRRDGRIGGPGRREIGHGALAERSLEPMLPIKTYPYAIRVTSEIMESNGSTSMATVCGGTLALMDRGCPMIRPVAGISIGLCTEYGRDKQISRYNFSPTSSAGRTRSATWTARSPARTRASPVSNWISSCAVFRRRS